MSSPPHLSGHGIIIVRSLISKVATYEKCTDKIIQVPSISAILKTILLAAL